MDLTTRRSIYAPSMDSVASEFPDNPNKRNKSYLKAIDLIQEARAKGGILRKEMTVLVNTVALAIRNDIKAWVDDVVKAAEAKREASSKAWSERRDAAGITGKSTPEEHEAFLAADPYPEYKRIPSVYGTVDDIERIDRIIAETEANGYSEVADAYRKLKAQYDAMVKAVRSITVTDRKLTEEEKRKQAIVPKTKASAEVLAAINDVIEAQRPELVESYIRAQRDALSRIAAKHGGSLDGLARDKGEYGFLFSMIAKNLVPANRPNWLHRPAKEELARLEAAIAKAPAADKLRLTNEVRTLTDYLNTPRVFDEAVLLASANAYVDETFDFVRAKMMEKAGELETPKVKDMSGAQFELIGMLKGKPVTIRQQIIINVSVNGKLFNQYPARITYDGKAVSEAEYKTIMTT